MLKLLKVNHLLHNIQKLKLLQLTYNEKNFTTSIELVLGQVTVCNNYLNWVALLKSTLLIILK